MQSLVRERLPAVNSAPPRRSASASSPGVPPGRRRRPSGWRPRGPPRKRLQSLTWVRMLSGQPPMPRKPPRWRTRNGRMRSKTRFAGNSITWMSKPGLLFVACRRSVRIRPVRSGPDFSRPASSPRSSARFRRTWLNLTTRRHPTEYCPQPDRHMDGRHGRGEHWISPRGRPPLPRACRRVPIRHHTRMPPSLRSPKSLSPFMCRSLRTTLSKVGWIILLVLNAMMLLNHLVGTAVIAACLTSARCSSTIGDERLCCSGAGFPVSSASRLGAVGQLDPGARDRRRVLHRRLDTHRMVVRSDSPRDGPRATRDASRLLPRRMTVVGACVGTASVSGAADRHHHDLPCSISPKSSGEPRPVWREPR